MICLNCGRDNVPHLRYDPITQEPIGCIECMPEEAPEEMQNESKGVKLYFTYGTYGQPFKGGWTEVIAPDLQTAFKLYTAMHPAKAESGLFPYCDYYTEESFKRTEMYQKGNFGKFCQERIVAEVL